MNFAFSDEQEAFRDALRRFLSEKSPRSEVFRWMDTRNGYDPAVWKQMAGELGLQGIHLPEEHGGQGFGFLELVIACEEMGRALLCAPFFSTVCLAANAILNAGTEAQRTAFLPGIASGETVATLALLEPDGGWDPGDVTLAFERDGEGYTLRGRKTFVTDGCSANLLIVAARRPGSAGAEGITLFALRADAPGVATTPIDPLDATRKLADVEFDGARAERLGAEGESGAALARTLDQAALALAAECTGGAEQCLESAVAYANERIQFGRPIGSFQAIKHKCAEVLLEVESAKSAAYFAGWAATEVDQDLPLAASLAKAYCAEAYQRAAAENLQIHGGIGFTWEADPHLYFKRARANSVLFGDPTHHRARIAAAHGI